MATVDDHVVVKDGELFIVCGPDGDIRADVHNDGLYFQDMRHLSQYRLSIDGWPLDLLGDGADTIDRQTLYVTNATGGTHFEAIPRSLSVVRERTLAGAFTEQITFTNYGDQPLSLTVRLTIASDFRDIFDVRGFATADEAPVVRAMKESAAFTLQRTAPDGYRYRTLFTADPAPSGATVPTRGDGVPEAKIELAHAIQLAPADSATITYRVTPEVITAESDETPRRPLAAADAEQIATITTSNRAFDGILRRSYDDLRGLVTPLPGGQTLIAAGLPWYVAAFGRDSLIVGRQLLPFAPSYLAGSLRFLASTQGEKHDPNRDEQPGRIVHEVRFGDLSRRGVIPFSRYYGSVDATPLFLLMLSEYLNWTGDDDLLDDLRPNIDRALEWLATSGDSDGDGLVDFQRRPSSGLFNQGWKDSRDSLAHIDGTPVNGPIALIEVQGYVYAAKLGLARHLERRGESELAARLRTEASQLRDLVNQRFWMPDQRYYAEALDGDGRQLAGIASNPAHLLMCGLPDDDKAGAVVQRLLSPEMFSGWGVRTLSSAMPHFNPVSYHRGSVWPHDNGFVLWGLRRCSAIQELDRLATAIYEGASRVAGQRIPELISGYPRQGSPNEVPVSHPISCSPQAWAAGIPLVIVETLLGLRADASTRQLMLAPHLPAWLDEVNVRGLRLAGASLDLRVVRDGAGCHVETLSDSSGVTIVT